MLRAEAGGLEALRQKVLKRGVGEEEKRLRQGAPTLVQHCANCDRAAEVGGMHAFRAGPAAHAQMGYGNGTAWDRAKEWGHGTTWARGYLAACAGARLPTRGREVPPTAPLG